MRTIKSIGLANIMEEPQIKRKHYQQRKDLEKDFDKIRRENVCL